MQADSLSMVAWRLSGATLRGHRVGILWLFHNDRAAANFYSNTNPHRHPHDHPNTEQFCHPETYLDEEIALLNSGNFRQAHRNLTGYLHILF